MTEDKLSFSIALVALRNGFKIRRATWNDESYVRLQEKCFMVYRHDDGAPWTALHADWLSDDWQVVGGVPLLDR